MDFTDNLEIILLFLVDLGNSGLDLLISANYLPKLFGIIYLFRMFASAIRKERKDILLNGLSITTREKKGNTTEIGTASLWAQASHISCGLW